MGTFLLNAVFFGFSVYSILFSLIALIFKKNNKVFSDYYNSASIRLVRLAGILYFLKIGLDLIKAYKSASSEMDIYGLNMKLFGPEWWGFWTFVGAFALLPQLFWISTARRNKIIQFVVAALMLTVIFFERTIVLATSFHARMMMFKGPSFFEVLSSYSLRLLAFSVLLVITGVVSYGREVKRA